MLRILLKDAIVPKRNVMNHLYRQDVTEEGSKNVVSLELLLFIYLD